MFDSCRNFGLPTTTRALDNAYGTFASWCVKTSNLGYRNVSFIGSFGDGARQRMFACLLDAGSEPQEFTFIECSNRNDADDLWFALCERSRFVDNESVNLFHPLER